MGRLDGILHTPISNSSKHSYPVLSRCDLFGIIPGVLTGTTLVWLSPGLDDLGLATVFIGPILIGYLLYRFQLALRNEFSYPLTRSDVLAIGLGGWIGRWYYIEIPNGGLGVFDTLMFFSYIGIGGFCVYMMSKTVKILVTGSVSSDSPDNTTTSQPVISTEDDISTTEQSPIETETAGQNVTDSGLSPEAVPSSPHFSISYDSIEKGDLIGSGGNADVYRATASTDSGESTLAIKEPRMSGTIDTETMDQLINEAETWQQLDEHDHIVSVVDYGSAPLPWIGMEYMDSGDLSDRAGELSFEQSLWTALVITKGVRYAHKRGVAHLDLKPTNILFRSVEDAWDVPKVADWGLSKHLLEHSQSVEGMSPRYAAPEQLDSEQFGQTDTVTDVYQLGTVLYELFTGEPHFSGDTYEVMNKIQSATPTPPSERADLPEAIDDILMTALETERNDRYDDVIFLRDALRDVWDDYK